MAYSETPTDSGLYFVDHDLIDSIAYDSFYLQEKLENTTIVKEKEGWGLPETQHVEINFSRAKAKAKSRSGAFLAQCSNSADAIETLKDDLYNLELAGRTAANDLKKMQVATSKKSIAAINNSVGRWETALEIAKFTRNASADIVLIGSAVVTGGTTMYAAGAGGSILKGMFKYQDTNNVGAAVMESTMSMVTFVIPGPKAGMDKAVARTLVFTKAKMEFLGNTSVGLIEGKSIGEASLSAAVDGVLGAAAGKVTGKLIPAKDMEALLKSGMENVLVPVALGMMDRSVATAKGKLTDAATKSIIARIKSGEAGLGAASKAKKATVSAPVLVDYAILGPDGSNQPRAWN